MRGFVQLHLSTGDVVNGISADISSDDAAELHKLFSNFEKLDYLRIIPFSRATQDAADLDEEDDNDYIYYNPRHVVSAQLIVESK